MSTFQYDETILKKYPLTIGGVILAHNLTNGETPESFHTAYRNEQAAVTKRIGQTPLSLLPSLAAWRGIFRSFGIDPTQYRSAAEALLRRLTKKGDIPSINTLVDIGNLVSIRYALPVAIFDTHMLREPVTVRFASGTECYITLGQEEVDHPESGEVIFADESGLVIARRWCWRQSETSAAQASTTDAIIVVEAQHANGRVDVQAALNDLLELLQKYTNGNVTSDILDATHPGI